MAHLRRTSNASRAALQPHQSRRSPRASVRSNHVAARTEARRLLVVQLSAPDYIVLIVADLDRSVRFYTDVLGLPLGQIELVNAS